MQHIKLGTTLQRGKYRVEAVIGEGGFGNTYMATNCKNGQRIAIKEFFWRGVTERDDMTGSISVSDISLYEVFKQQKEKFRKEAARLQHFNNPHIVHVYDQFEENGTAYYVMDFIDGESLSEKMKRTGLPLTEQEVRELLPQMLDALKCVHDAGLLHLDLKPGNLMVDKQGNVKLIDFGASKQLDTQRGGATAKTRQTYTNGYAPREQMDENFSKYGPWTDLYALGATLYCLLTKRRPPMPLDLDDDESDDKHIALPFPENISEDTKSLIRWMMNTNRSRRPQSVSEMMGFANTTSQQSSHHYSNYSETTFFSGQVGNERTQVTHHQNNEENRFSQTNSTNEQTIASQQNGYNSYNHNIYNDNRNNYNAYNDNRNNYSANNYPQKSSSNSLVPILVIAVIVGFIIFLLVLVSNGGAFGGTKVLPSVDTIGMSESYDDIALADTFVTEPAATENKYSEDNDTYGVPPAPKFTEAEIWVDEPDFLKDEFASGCAKVKKPYYGYVISSEEYDEGEIWVTLQEVETRVKSDFCIYRNEMSQASLSWLPYVLVEGNKVKVEYYRCGSGGYQYVLTMKNLRRE